MTPSATQPVSISPPPRAPSVDVYRGFVMFLMMAEVLHLAQVSRNLPESELWKFLAFNQNHVAWRGCSLHDLIQPSFSFLVGVSLPFSIAARRARGQSAGLSWFHAFWRAAVLIFLGIFLRSVGHKLTNFTFEDTLTQIGLGYVFLFALGHVRVAWQWLAFAIILIGYWGWFATYQPELSPTEYAAVSDLKPEDRPEGFAAHWEKNANPAAEFDKWFLNQFPREQPFTHNRGGYLTLSFIPTLGTMILGLIAGGWLHAPGRPWRKVCQFVLLGVCLLGAGWLLDALGICPSVKRIWTPAWVLFSGGLSFAVLNRAIFAV